MEQQHKEPEIIHLHRYRHRSTFPRPRRPTCRAYNWGMCGGPQATRGLACCGETYVREPGEQWWVVWDSC